MGLKIKILSFIIGLVFFISVFIYNKRNMFKASYAVLWMAVSAFLLSIPLFEFFYRWVSTSVIGIKDTRHIIYIVLIGFLLIYVFYLTKKISQMSDQIQELISYTAILETEFDQKLEELQANSPARDAPMEKT